MKTKMIKEIAPASELELLSLDRAANILRVRPADIVSAMNLYVQSGGRDGLPFISKGSRKVIRAGALKAYLIAQEKKELVA